MKKSIKKDIHEAKSFNTLPSRFLEKTKQEDNGCIVWVAFKDNNGYGKFGIGRKVYLAHRIAYEYVFGRIPKGLELDHLCRNTSCVNPKHLEAVTHRMNCQRGLVGYKDKIKTHCPKGHEYIEENIYWYGGRRYCKKCHYIYSKNYRLKHKEV